VGFGILNEKGKKKSRKLNQQPTNNLLKDSPDNVCPYIVHVLASQTVKPFSSILHQQISFYTYFHQEYVSN